ncbi:FAS1 domain-containing protein SELMODRAFT_448915-like [Cajanus cajan]|uniref:FAS1 domain-containing protein SELMODRAFT_448915-like n=1 Tax=Cajanus cajan TaxID=3821 RepID=UPI00098D9F50|nr:FAS1 domain-containing protein SELMODRAFT_448915-like [Cajanus cajan]
MLLLFFVLTMVAPSAPTPTTPTQEMNNIVDALIGAGDLSAWVSILSSANATGLPVSATLFVPRDGTGNRPPPDPFLLPYHVVPQRLLFSDLLLLPRLARLPTLLGAKSISVTDNSPGNFSLDGIPLTHPDLYSTPSLAVHALQTFLNYDLFGDGLPPPPPPVAYAISTHSNQAAPSFCSRPDDTVLLLFFYFLLLVLL